jgi:adenylate cyclase
MAGVNVEVSILFADVCGSTRLYETLGDRAAQQAIGECIEFMRAIVERHHGIVIKTIGDEVMCRFDQAEHAVEAACDIQETNETAGMRFAGQRLALRAGLHHGPAILENGDVFGDAVNVAARMAGIAKAAQVITTGDTVDLLPAHLGEMAREVDRATVKGKSEELRICEVVWEQEDVTHMAGFDSKPKTVAARLVVHYDGADHEIQSTSHPVFTLGRGADCDLRVAASLASRVHCRIEFRRGKFVLVDQSTNGTFVRTQEGEDVYLRREELMLWGAGVLSLGEEITTANEHLVHFLCPGGAGG